MTDALTPSEPHYVVARELGLNTARVRGYSHVSLDLASNRAHALCAERGSGTTELLLTLAGRMRPSEGTLRVAGIDTATRRGVGRLRRVSGLGFFEGVNDVERMLRVRTVASAELALAGRRSDRAATLAYLERWDLAGVASASVEELASHDFHRLGIALGMVCDPRLLVVDDVERDLTERQSLELARELCHLARERALTIVCGVTDYGLARHFDTATCLTDAARAQRSAPPVERMREVA